MLGHLAKWLRVLGFDAAYPCKAPSPGRTFITAKRIAAGSDTIIVEDQDPLDQLKQALEHAGISTDPGLFLSRCLLCNVPVKEVPRDRIAGRVPELIFQALTKFNECPRCGRVFWEGSHAERMKMRLQKMGLPS